jgi:hypothetical protein
MTLKQVHCRPIWSTPRSAAKQPNGLMSVQQAQSARLAGRTRMLATAALQDVVPSSTK